MTLSQHELNRWRVARFLTLPFRHQVTIGQGLGILTQEDHP